MVLRLALPTLVKTAASAIENAAGVPECECPDDFVGDNCETPVALQDCNVDLDRIGDGICENSLNILACLYDGGDCCESTCSQDPARAQVTQPASTRRHAKISQPAI